MLGYCDPWDDIGNSTPGSGEAAAIYDNVRVVQLSVPTIAVEPTNTIAALGGNAGFAVTATTSTGITNYQWYANGVAISNATSATLTVSPVTANSYGTAYAVQVSDGAYSVWSSNATVVPSTGPIILTEPSSRAAVVGSSPSFSVTASTSTTTTNYQWMYYNTNIAGAMSRTLTLNNVQTNSFGGPYTVRVSDGFTSVTSSPPVTLTFATSPTMTSPARHGTNFTFSIGTEVGPSYVLDYKSALTNAAWVHVSTNAGTGGVLSITNTSSNPEGYYRIHVQ
jgi:hypothetical protein